MRDEFADFDPEQERQFNASRTAKKQKAQATRDRARQKENAEQVARRTSPGPTPEARPHSLYQPAHEEGPGGQQRLFNPSEEPEAFETKYQKRARTERVPAPRREWKNIRPGGPGRGVSQESVQALLKEQGVTTQGARARLRSHWQGAQKRAEGGMPKGQDFYASEQSNRIEADANHFHVPFHVALAVNAVMSPKTALATPTGLQTNREAAFRVMQHVTAGLPGTPDTGGRGLRANAQKAAEIMRQHLATGTHPLDATDETGHHLLSGPKVEEYYASHIDPSRSPTDIQHSRILFGPKVRSEMSPEETAEKDRLVAEHGKNSPEVGRFIPKTPAEKLLSKSGVHEWAAHVTGEAAKEAGVHRSEFQSVAWHEHKTRRGGRSAVQEEVQPLFVSRRKVGLGSTQPQLPLRKKSGGRNLSGSQFGMS